MARAVREHDRLRQALAEQINALAQGQTVAELIDQATVVVRSHVLGGLADLRDDPTNAPAWAAALPDRPDVQNANWNQLGEALLFEVGTTGQIGTG